MYHYVSSRNDLAEGTAPDETLCGPVYMFGQWTILALFLALFLATYSHSFLQKCHRQCNSRYGTAVIDFRLATFKNRPDIDLRLNSTCFLTPQLYLNQVFTKKDFTAISVHTAQLG